MKTLVFVIAITSAAPVAAQQLFDHAIPPGVNFDKAEFIGDLKAFTFQPVAGATAPTVPTAWLPTERIAKAWQAVVTGKPFEQ